MDRGYPQTLIENLLSKIRFTERDSKLLKQNNKEEKEILPFVTLDLFKRNNLKPLDIIFFLARKNQSHNNKLFLARKCQDIKK